MGKTNIATLAALLFVLLSGFVALQAYWIAQLDIPYPLQALLAFSGGMIVGYAATILVFVWRISHQSFR